MHMEQYIRKSLLEMVKTYTDSSLLHDANFVSKIKDECELDRLAVINSICLSYKAKSNQVWLQVRRKLINYLIELGHVWK